MVSVVTFQSEAWGRDLIAWCRLEAPALLHHHEGRWSRPLFHLEATGRSGLLFVAEAPNLDDTFDPKKGRLGSIAAMNTAFDIVDATLSTLPR